MEKQGAYGKLVTHSESKLSQIARLDEVFGAVWFTKVRPMPGHVDVMMFGDELKDDVEYCDDVLGKVLTATTTTTTTITITITTTTTTTTTPTTTTTTLPLPPLVSPLPLPPLHPTTSPPYQLTILGLAQLCDGHPPASP